MRKNIKHSTQCFITRWNTSKFWNILRCASYFQLSSRCGDETLRLMFDILHKITNQAFADHRHEYESCGAKNMLYTTVHKQFIINHCRNILSVKTVSKQSLLDFFFPTNDSGLPQSRPIGSFIRTMYFLGFQSFFFNTPEKSVNIYFRKLSNRLLLWYLRKVQPYLVVK